MKSRLGSYQSAVDAALHQMRADHVVARIWQHDHTVWRADPTEIINRLGWLHAPAAMPAYVDYIMAIVDAVRADGYTHALLLGMGGSSLAPEVFFRVFGQPAGPDNAYLELAIVDSTDPDMIRARIAGLDLSKTLFIVSTKSGGTVETLSAFKYYYNQVVNAVGTEKAGTHFVAITDPGSTLVDMAAQYSFRHTFLNDPNIGGRYSVLSFFGLVPAALVGVDLAKLLERAQAGAGDGQESVGDSARLGAIMGVLAQQGRDKVTISTSPRLAAFGDWVEQLIAESTGKDGKGILPVVGEELGTPKVYGDDRLFVDLRLAGDDAAGAQIEALMAAGQPVVTLNLKDIYDLGSQFVLWEMATIIAGMIIDIQPFDQPNVEAAKVLARQMVKAYEEKGELPPSETAPLHGAALRHFLAQAKMGDYLSLQAYVQPTAASDAALNNLRIALRDHYKLATTVGYGPRFLHSTGQLHKGDSGNGLFIQCIGEPRQDEPIPDVAGKPGSSISFGVLKKAQALGDAQALRESKRRLIRFDLGSDVVGGLQKLVDSIGS